MWKPNHTNFVLFCSCMLFIVTMGVRLFRGEPITGELGVLAFVMGVLAERERAAYFADDGDEEDADDDEGSSYH